MPIEITENDMTTCIRCMKPVLSVGYWEEEENKPVVLLVDFSFDYEFKRRDKVGRLIVETSEEAKKMAHTWRCPVLAALPDEQDETKPYQKP